MQVYINVITVYFPIAMQTLTMNCTEMLTWVTAWAALSIRNSSISTGDQGAGDLAAHSSRVLRKHRDQMYG